ncbi:enoyl-CoA delta isomerase 2-like [Lethenteron reissneri]|uniref:enoyl-CoA delta isomerase 2-like n=1 Tax=Lethenteron reissneri TaxID=7753 RepID=UPI002AB6F3DF|nr:enoyl-CoA delta isomerase 2-like [Lethenteron reissneri]
MAAGAQLGGLLHRASFRTVPWRDDPRASLGSSTVAMRPVASEAEFEAAKQRLGQLTSDPGNEAKLQIYALFKQSTQGSCNTPKPGMLDFVNKMKWEAWKNLGPLSKEEARLKYVQLIDSLVAAEAPAAPSTEAGATAYQTLQLKRENNMTVITLNRPDKKNAINTTMYKEIMKALEEAGKDESAFAVITGAGDYFCSGNDLSNFTNMPPGGIKQMALDAAELLRRFVSSFIEFPKPLVAVVNGPAVGVAVTLLGLYDAVYATSRATFQTPFSQLGQSPEGCSSYIFPKLMGAAKATEMLLFNKRLTSQQACDLGLVTEVYPDNSFQREVWARLETLAKLPKKSLAFSKQLSRDAEREALHAANLRECQCLIERWQSEDCMAAIAGFFQRKAKL